MVSLAEGAACRRTSIMASGARWTPLEIEMPWSPCGRRVRHRGDRGDSDGAVEWPAGSRDRSHRFQGARGFRCSCLGSVAT